MSDLGWESLDRGDWKRSTVKFMDPWRPGTRIPPLGRTDADDGEEKS
jgi:hypothetical protein